MRYAIVDHGYEDSQYWQGVSTHGTSWSNVVTGIGDTPQEAYENAVECLYQHYSHAAVCTLRLPQHVPGPEKHASIPAEHCTDDTYWRISIMHNLEDTAHGMD